MRDRFPRPWASRLSRATVLCIVVCGLLFARSLRAQAVSELVTSDQPIPEDCKSWSLFLICNPAWVVPEGASNLESLYSQFQAFGGVLGPEHVAVWFWSREWSWDEQEELHTAVDVVRSSAFCSLLDLPLGDSPYVVVTTEYPGEARVSTYPETFHKPENFYVLALNGVPASEATELLTRLANQIVAERLTEVDLGSEGYWRRWQQIFESLQSGLVDFSKTIRVTLNTQFFTVEMSPE